MDKPWNLRLKPVSKDKYVIDKRKNNAHAKIAREIINEKNSQLEMAVKHQMINVAGRL